MLPAHRRLFDFLLPAARVWADWVALGSSPSQLVALSPNELSELSTAWYSVDGGPGDWRERDAMRLTVAEASTLGLPGDKGRAHIDSLVSRYERMESVAVTLLTVESPLGEIIILDGNHRAVALHEFTATGGVAEVSALVLTIPLIGRIADARNKHLAYCDLIHDNVARGEDWDYLVAEVEARFS